MESFPRDAGLAGRAYQELFRGEDTDEAEAAGMHLAQVVGLITQYLTKK